MHHDPEAVFLAQFYGADCVFLRSLVISHPVVEADAVKRDFHQGITADLLKFVKGGLIDEKAVGIQLKNIHSAAVYAL